MLSFIEAWWAGLCALPFDGAQGDTLSQSFGSCRVTIITRPPAAETRPS